MNKEQPIKGKDDWDERFFTELKKDNPYQHYIDWVKKNPPHSPVPVKEAEQEDEANIIAFAKHYHNHVMETSNPPYKERFSIKDLYESFFKQSTTKPLK